MKKTSLILLMILIITCVFTTFSFATDPNSQEQEETAEETPAEEAAESTEEVKESVTNTLGKIVETNGVKEIVTGSVVDQVQEVVVEIIKGDYIGEEFTTQYVLSYDLEGKMLVYDLDVGDKVEVQITEDKDGNTTATVMEVYRTNNIMWIVGIFFVSIILISGRKGIRTILGFIFTLSFISPLNSFIVS